MFTDPAGPNHLMFAGPAGPKAAKKKPNVFFLVSAAAGNPGCFPVFFCFPRNLAEIRTSTSNSQGFPGAKRRESFSRVFSSWGPEIREQKKVHVLSLAGDPKVTRFH